MLDINKIAMKTFKNSKPDDFKINFVIFKLFYIIISFFTTSDTCDFTIYLVES